MNVKNDKIIKFKISYKRVISIFLIISIIFNTLICPISFAVTYEFGPEKETLSLDWTKLDSIYDVFGEAYYSASHTIPITVSKSGIYCASNMFGGNISSNFVVSAKVSSDAEGVDVRAPLPIATYGTDGECTMDMAKYNNATQNKVSVYLEVGQTYYITFIADKGGSISKQNLTQSPSVNVSLEYIEPKAGETVYETDISSMKYSANDVTLKAEYHYSGMHTKEFDSYTYTSDKAKLSQLVGLYKTQETISGDSVTSALEKADSGKKLETDESASWIETAATALVLLICDGLRAAIGWVVGEDGISIDDVLFNNYSNTRISLFKSTRSGDNENNYLAESGMLDTVDANGVTQEGVITKYFMLFRNIAIAIYLVMLLYMGVNILFHSTGKRKEKYKSKIVDWLKGVIILVMFPYIMKYTIVINDAIVEYIEEIKENLDLPTNLPTMEGVSVEAGKALNVVNSNAGNGDIMDTMSAQARKTGRLAYAMLYLFLIIKMIGFIYMYFKRLISVIFLVIIFPLVTISYAVDKIGDGKSQAFDTWFKEYVLNIFMQSFQAVNYVVVMSVIFALTAAGGTTNVILMLIGLEYVSKGDEILRGMFTKMSGGGANTVPKNLSEATKTIATMSVAKKLSENITGVGKRFTNVAHKASDMRDAYNEHISQKYDERIREREYQAVMQERSMSNPEWAATSNVSGNMDMLFAAPGTYTDEQMKEVLDRLAVAQNDATLKGDFEAKYASLTPDQQKHVDEMMAKNNAINETVNGNVGINGPLTNLEINFNAKLLIEIFENGRKVEEHMRLGGVLGQLNEKEVQDYQLYKYMQGKRILDENGNEETLAEYIEKKANKRTLDTNQLNKMKQLQIFSGNVTGIDDTTRTGTNRVRRTSHDALERRAVSARETSRKDALLNRVGTTGISTEARRKREDAARLVARIKEYKEAVNEGSSEGCSATEMMQLASQWRALSTETDAGVTEILNELSDLMGPVSSSNSDENVLEQFETMASLAVIYDKEHLEGTEAEKTQMYNEAVQKVVEVSTGVKREDNGGGIQMVEYTPDRVAQNMVNRAELDDMVQKFSGQTRIDTRGYIRTGGTQEDKRNARVVQARRVQIESEYDRMQVNSSMTQAKLIRKTVEFGGATASAVAAPLNIATGAATTALLTGSTKAQVDPSAIASTMVVGTSLENFAEKLVPGTNAAQASGKTVGARLSESLGNSYDSSSDARVNAELNARYVQNNQARNMIDNVKNKLS